VIYVGSGDKGIHAPIPMKDHQNGDGKPTGKNRN
jgi:hypothetical protein